MGGYGSGRWPWGYRRKTTTAECSSFDVADLATALGLGPGYRGTITWTRGGQQVGSLGFRIVKESGGTAVRLSYAITGPGAQAEYDYLVAITWAKAGFGSPRPFFLCPGRACGRRVAKLYRPPSGDLFLCRHCHNLTYQSCLDSHKYDSLWRNLGPFPGDISPSGLERSRLLAGLLGRLGGSRP